MKRFVKRMAVNLVLILAGSSLVSCGGESSASGTGTKSASFSYWLGTIDQGYYNDYAENPVIKYLTKYKKWGKDKETAVDFSFIIPPVGEQTNNLNTILSSGEYPDLLDASYFSDSIESLYEDGVIMDLSEYVEKDMPNYKKWLDNHPDYAKTAKNVINGETKYLQLYTYHDTGEAWGGFSYRRDWIAKYGKNPSTGASFTGSWDEKGVWNDDVIFPSGGKDPVYVSDWEWMFKIFDLARADLGISDGYDFSMYYPGYIETGDLVDAFGGHGPMFYAADGKIEFGGVSNGFRTYLQMMNQWYKKGYLDNKFAEHSSDMFYQVDTKKVYSGKVGMWYGMVSQQGKGLDISQGKPDSATNGYTNGICVYGARQPINNTYGTDAEKNVTPYNFFGVSSEKTATVISTKATDKDLDALFSFLDYQFSEEGAILNSMGLSKEQYEECQDPLYTKYGLTDGAWYYCDQNGDKWVEGTSQGDKYYHMAPACSADNAFSNAMKNNRVFGRQFGSNHTFAGYDTETTHAIAEWQYFEDTGSFKKSFTSQLGVEASLANSKIMTSLREFMNKQAPGFVNGSKDATNDDTWNSFCGALKKYKYQDYIDNLQVILDSLK
ncbi:MAG: hypothetical protein LKJ88_07360 [Bacilli bacterium]|nr:hypothetical protein [Bacilli bacterium]